MGQKVSATHYPNVFRAFIEILYDNDGINREEPEPKAIEVPDAFVPFLKDADGCLGVMTEEEFQTYCVGEDTEREAIRELYDSDGRAADIILSGFFGHWDEGVLDGVQQEDRG